MCGRPTACGDARFGAATPRRVRLAAEQAIDWGFFAGTLYLLALFLFEPQTPLSGDYLANPPG